MVFENVPGAFSTGTPKGADFQAVLEEAIRIAEPEAPSIPIPPKGWNTSGCIVDGLGRWSLAWRVTDAQYWGVPQRRRRISMVVDFNGVTAPQIVFGDAELQRSTASAGGNKAVGHLGAECGREVSSVEDGLRGYLEESEPQRKEAAGDAGASAGVPHRDGESAVGADLYNYALTGNTAATLSANSCITGTRNGPTVVFGISQYHSNAMMSSNPAECVDSRGRAMGQTTDTLRSNCHGATPIVAEQRMPDKGNSNCVITAPGVTIGTFQETGIGWWNESEIGATLRAMSGGDSMKANLCAFGVDCRNMNESPELYPTLQAKPNGGQSLNYSHAVRTKYIVRRLTPLECERLQGFPDGWTDIGEWVDSKGKKHKASDSPRYKALGNSISIPNWKYIIKRLCSHYERDATMASLFDGIGGFPYIWEQLNGKGSCLWASEIEEFPMAVTRMRFGE
jgi:DNA (cytosine-5)-methyltransferase 1